MTVQSARIKTLKELARSIMENPTCVLIDDRGLQSLGDHLADWKSCWLETAPDPEQLVRKGRHYLIANSVNYCFWENKADHKPAGGAASLFAKVERFVESSTGWHEPARKLLEWITDMPFPLKEERIRHVSEILNVPEHRFDHLLETISRGATGDGIVELLIGLLPSLGEDPFLKRAVLFPQAIFKDTGYGVGIEQLPIPADYQNPKMFRFWNVLTYAPDLEAKVENGTELAPGGREEMEIRAATVQVAERLHDQRGIPPYVLDDFTWHQRKSSAAPYHLTRTTHY